MGYTHYWDRPQSIAADTFNRVREDFTQLLPALETAGVQLGNAWGRELPEIRSEFLGFNGAENCGHARNLKICLPWPTAEACGIGDNQDLAGTLPYRTCNGDCSYESVWFERSMSPEQADENGIYSGACKTAFRPYDLAVTAFLLILQHHLGSEISIWSDGGQRQWENARLLCQEQLGHGAEYILSPERRLVSCAVVSR